MRSPVRAWKIVGRPWDSHPGFFTTSELIEVVLSPHSWPVGADEGLPGTSNDEAFRRAFPSGLALCGWT
jgi:hypothetical protein